MTNQERIVRVNSIVRRENIGEITKEQAVLEFDELLMSEEPDGRLIYCSDSTGLTAPWDPDVMLFPKAASTIENRIPSNTGIYARGPQRGWLVTFPAGATIDCHEAVLDHFRQGSKGWLGRRPQ